jgi:opacity protein-like surface antigen
MIKIKSSKQIVCVLATAMTLGAVSAGAQTSNNVAADNPQPVEAAVTFSYVNARNTPPNGTTNVQMIGGGASVAYYAGPRFALVGEFSGVNQANVAAPGQRLTLESYLFGPRFVVHNGHRLVLYVQGTGGVTHDTGPAAILLSATNPASPQFLVFRHNTFSFAAGGGLDYRLSRHLTLRAVQAEYFLTKLPTNFGNPRENNLKLDSGLAYRF